MSRTARKSRTASVESVPSETTVADEGTDPIATLTAAYWAAIDDRDVTTGTIPDAPFDAVKVAYRAVPKRQRGDIAAKLGAEAAEKMMLDNGTVDAGLAVAMARLAGLFNAVNQERRVREPTPYDPVPAAAALLSGLDIAHRTVLDGLTDDQREHVAAFDVDADETADAMRQKVLAKLTPNINRALNGGPRRSSSNGTRGPGVPARNVAELVQAAVANADGPVILNALARDHDVSTGALGNRWAKDNIPGVSCVQHDGRKAFVAA